MSSLVPFRSSAALVLAVAISSAAWGADARPEASGNHPAGVSTNGLLSGFRLEWSWPDATNAPQLLQEMRKNPDSTATPLFEMAASDAASKLSTLKGEQREARAAQLIHMLREANAILDAAIQASPGNTNLPVYRLLVSFDLPAVLFEAGTNNLDEVRTLTRQILDRNTNTSLPFYAPFRFTANELLGRVALRQKKPEKARAYLRAAGKVLVASMVNGFNADRDTKAPLVNKFSDLRLARELLEHGGKQDREAVISFLDDIARWVKADSSTNAKSQRYAADQLKQLDEWRRQIRDGKIPSDPK